MESAEKHTFISQCTKGLKLFSSVIDWRGDIIFCKIPSTLMFGAILFVDSSRHSNGISKVAVFFNCSFCVFLKRFYSSFEDDVWFFR